MAKKKKEPKQPKQPKQPKGRAGVLYAAVMGLFMAVSVVLACTVFFRVEQVEVSGNSRYTVEEITAVCGVEPGDNLILLNKYQIAQQLYTQLPYITNVRVNRKLPDQLLVEVTETKVALTIEGGGAWWLLSESGKVLDVAEGDAEGYLLLRGVAPEGIAVGEQLRLAAGNLSAERLLELVAALSERNMLEKTDWVDASDGEILRIGYDGRFEVELFYNADFDFKVNCLRSVVEELEPNETGTIRMTMEDENEVRFIPLRP